jgi:16S rRNA (cytosine967-C5)-methyltransferase
MRSHSWIQTAASIVREYDGGIPLSAWLKQYFKEHPKAGSTDRKQIAHLCYCFYRLGSSFTHLETEERFLTANFLCSDGPNKVLEELRPEWNEQVRLSPDEKIEIVSGESEIKKIFPFVSSLSQSIDRNEFHESFLVQPELFLRIRPGKQEEVHKKLKDRGIQFALRNEHCIALDNQTKVEDVLKIDEEIVVQDFNSQQVLNPLEVLIDKNLSFKSWDCCAASGGKSILLHDQYPNAKLNVSDVRPAILLNLQNRFKRAGIKNFRHFISDIASPAFRLAEKFDLVICDAPCSGSGTWGRTPEQLAFFKEEKINYYAGLQKKIAMNAARQLNERGIFLYITCSVFSQENEEVVVFIEEQLKMKLISSQYLRGYNERADTLFASVFTRS